MICTGPVKLLRRADVKRYRKITSVKAVAVLIAQFLCGQTRILCIFCIFLCGQSWILCIFICFWVGNHGYYEYFRCEHIHHRCESLSCIICISDVRTTSTGEDEKEFCFSSWEGGSMQKYILKSSKVVSKALLVLHVLLVPHAWGAQRMNFIIIGINHRE